MDFEHGEDLGHGVYASPSTGDELIVSTPGFDLGWREADGKTPGSAVVWRGEPFQVVDRFKAGRGERWVLRRWDQATAMRGVFTLEAGSIREIAERSVADVRGRRIRGSTIVLLPFLGLAPARLQQRWADKWGFNAERATQLSAVFEMLAGGLGILQVAAAAFGGDLFMPLWLAYPGPLLFAFGAGRLALVFADGEPVGSPLGAPLLLLTPKPTPPSERPTPRVRSIDETNGILELVSPILRRDWDRDGTLRFRGKPYRLRRTDQEGRDWVYVFERCVGDDPGGRTLRLAPPIEAAFEPPHAEADPPSIIRTTLVTAGVTLGPKSDQELWGEHLGVHPMWLTLVGAGAELLGGIVNLQKDLGPEASILVVLDLFLVGEGLLRIGSALTGRPMGSVFGWVLRPIYRRWLPGEP